MQLRVSRGAFYLKQIFFFALLYFFQLEIIVDLPLKILYSFELACIIFTSLGLGKV